MQTIVEMEENSKESHAATARVRNRPLKYRIVPYLTENLHRHSEKMQTPQRKGTGPGIRTRNRLAARQQR